MFSLFCKGHKAIKREKEQDPLVMFAGGFFISSRDTEFSEWCSGILVNTLKEIRR